MSHDKCNKEDSSLSTENSESTNNASLEHKNTSEALFKESPIAAENLSSPGVSVDVTQSGSRELPEVEDTRELGRQFGKILQAGDLVILDGPLGAGKTAITGGIAQGLQVAGRVTSPTFVIAREHPPLIEGKPGMVHIDAYRLLGDAVDSTFSYHTDTNANTDADICTAGDIERENSSGNDENEEKSAKNLEALHSLTTSADNNAVNSDNPRQTLSIRDELESLDLDSMIDTSVLVVEWGAGFVEDVGERVLTISLRRYPETDVRTARWSWSA